MIWRRSALAAVDPLVGDERGETLSDRLGLGRSGEDGEGVGSSAELGLVAGASHVALGALGRGLDVDVGRRSTEALGSVPKRERKRKRKKKSEHVEC